MHAKHNRQSPNRLRLLDASGAKRIATGEPPSVVASSLDLRALDLERSAGTPPALVTEDGIRTIDDWRYILAVGRRDLEGPLEGAVFFDPTSTDTILVDPTPDGECLIRQGTVDVELLFEKSHDTYTRLLAGCVASLDQAYDQKRKEVSNWLVSHGSLAVIRALEENGAEAIDVDWEALVEPTVPAIWSTLAQRGVIQPWASGACP